MRWSWCSHCAKLYRFHWFGGLPIVIWTRRHAARAIPQNNILLSRERLFVLECVHSLHFFRLVRVRWKNLLPLCKQMRRFISVPFRREIDGFIQSAAGAIIVVHQLCAARSTFLHSTEMRMRYIMHCARWPRVLWSPNAVGLDFVCLPLSSGAVWPAMHYWDLSPLRSAHQIHHNAADSSTGITIRSDCLRGFYPCMQLARPHSSVKGRTIKLMKC